MTEYLSKKAVLEWLDDRRYKSPWIESFRERLEAGAFDADESEGTWKATAEILARENEQMSGEIQRLRVALERIMQLIDNAKKGTEEQLIFRIWTTANEALSATTESEDEIDMMSYAAGWEDSKEFHAERSTEPTGAERVREAWKKIPTLPIDQGDHSIYRAGFIDGISAAGITIPGFNAPEKEE